MLNDPILDENIANRIATTPSQESSRTTPLNAYESSTSASFDSGVLAPVSTAGVAPGERKLDRLLRLIIAALLGVVAAVDLVQTAAASPTVGATRFARWSAFELLAGARFGLLCSGVALIVVLYGVLRGRRNAWRVGALATIASSLAHPTIFGDMSTRVLALVVLAVLLISRKLFQAASDPRSHRNALVDGAVGLGVVFGYAVTGLYFLDSQFRSATTLGEAFTGSVRLLLLQKVEVVSPISRHGHWFIDSVRLGVAAVLVNLVVKLVKPVLRPNRLPAITRESVLLVLNEYADSTLAYFHTLPDKYFVVSGDQRAFVGYTLVGSTALALGDPIGDRHAKARALRDFLELCRANGWVPGFHQATGATLHLLAPAGFRATKVGEEAFVELDTFDLSQPQWKSLRSALRRVERNGFHVVELEQPLKEADLAQLRSVSQRWKEEGRHRERTFTVGQFSDEYLRSTRVLALQKDDGAIVAFVNLLPRYQSAVGNFDLMRRNSGSPNGTMEALFVAMIELFRQEGCQRMTLGMAPLTGITGTSPVDRILRALHRSGRGFHYAGLRSFKEKWHPTWEPRFLLYPSEVALARMARAVPKAGELGGVSSFTKRLGAAARKYPLTSGVLAITFTTMALGAVQHRWHTLLLNWFGLAGNDLTRGQLWRIATNAFFSPKAGFMWSEVALLAVALPIAESVLSTKRALIVAVTGDWIATIIVLVAVRIFVPKYSQTAAFYHRDAGASVAAWALAAAAAVKVEPRRLRLAARVFVLVWLVGAVFVHHQAFDVQHLIGGSIGALIAFRFQPAE
jgi:phosphatidylglycerol lysyltransferase